MNDRADEIGMYISFRHCLVRAPLLPVEDFLILASQESGAPDPLETILSQPTTILALKTASESIYTAYSRSKHARKQPAPKLRRKLLRYCIRMSTRGTPFGLLAGVAMAQIASKTDLSIVNAQRVRASRPDMGWLRGFVDRTEALPGVRSHLSFCCNPNLRVEAGRVLVPTSDDAQEGQLSIRATEPVLLTIQMADSLIPHCELRDRLIRAVGISCHQAETFLEHLWQHRILLSDLTPSLTCSEPAKLVAIRLESIPAAHNNADELLKSIDELAQADDSDALVAPGRYMAVEKRLRSLHDHQGPVIQTDSKIPLLKRGIHYSVGEEAARAAELLLRMSPLQNGPRSLAAYREAFKRRYRDGQEVNVLDLYSSDTGLGPIDDLPKVSTVDRDEERRASILSRLACQALHERRLEIVLDEAVASSLQNTTTDLESSFPSTLDMNVIVSAPSASAIDRGEFLLVVAPNTGANNAGRTLARFANLLGDEAISLLKEIAECEASSDLSAISAELVYYPKRATLANVAVRPRIHSYEIHHGACSSDEHVNIIPIRELFCGVDEDGFYLYWPRGRNRVKVVNSHMVNVSQAPGICRFLANISLDNKPILNRFSWGPAESFPFLPRVRIGRIVLRPAEWRMDPQVHEEAIAKSSPEKFANDFKKWQIEWQVPRYVSLMRYDNLLLLDLNNVEHIVELFYELRQRSIGDPVVIEEALPLPSDIWCHSDNARFSTELVIALANRNSLQNWRDPKKNVNPGPPSKSKLLCPEGMKGRDLQQKWPGSDWLYIKLYGPTHSQDDLIVSHIRTKCLELEQKELVNSWFFLRYRDPYPHIRLRVHGDSDQLIQQVWPILCSWAAVLAQSGQLYEFGLETYDREIERYGGVEGMLLAERVFHADSIFTSALLEALKLRRCHMERGLMPVFSLNAFLDAFFSRGEQKLNWLRDTVHWRGTYGVSYRSVQGILRDTAMSIKDAENPTLTSIFDTWAQSMRCVADDCKKLEEARLSRNVGSILASLCHLHINRLLGPDKSEEQRVFELLLRLNESLGHAPL